MIKKKKISKKRKIIYTLATIIGIILILGIYNSYKPLPKGISLEGEYHNVSESSIDFLYDLTYEDSSGGRVYEQELFDEIYKKIDQAEKYILIDMFLWTRGEEEPYRDYAKELSTHIIDRKKQIPDLEVVVITDPYNTGYNSFEVEYFEDLKDNNIPVIFTNLNKLRDSNILYSPIWRTFFQILGEPTNGWIKIPGIPGKGSVRAFLKLLNFKANHRKTALMDCGNQMCSFVVSTNPSGSGAKHSNVGVSIVGGIYQDLYNSENSVIEMSGEEKLNWNFDFVEKQEQEKDIQIKLVTEGKIKESILEEIKSSEEGDEIKIAMFYFSERDITRELLDASERGVLIELILDPSKTGFGRDKFGIPSRFVADELVKKSNGKIKIRYYDTEEEQFHTKLIVFVKGNKIIIILGSANYTRRNLDDLNLESDVKLVIPKEKNISKEILNYFERIWTNENGASFTVSYEEFNKGSFLRKSQYRFQELFGSGTF